MFDNPLNWVGLIGGAYFSMVLYGLFLLLVECLRVLCFEFDCPWMCGSISWLLSLRLCGLSLRLWWLWPHGTLCPWGRWNCLPKKGSGRGICGLSVIAWFQRSLHVSLIGFYGLCMAIVWLLGFNFVERPAKERGFSLTYWTSRFWLGCTCSAWSKCDSSGSISWVLASGVWEWLRYLWSCLPIKEASRLGLPAKQGAIRVLRVLSPALPSLGMGAAGAAAFVICLLAFFFSRCRFSRISSCLDSHLRSPIKRLPHCVAFATLPCDVVC